MTISIDCIDLREGSVMPICVKSAGSLDLELYVEAADTIENVKYMIEDMAKIPVTRQKLFFAGNELVNAKTMTDYMIPAKASLHLKEKAEKNDYEI